MKEMIKKAVEALKMVFGYGIMITLFGGGATFLLYIAALIIGGNTAAAICAFVYKGVFPVLIKTTTIMVLLGILIMYMSGEMALTAGKKK